MLRSKRTLGFHAWRALGLFFLAEYLITKVDAEQAQRQLLTLGDGQSHVCNCP